MKHNLHAANLKYVCKLNVNQYKYVKKTTRNVLDLRLKLKLAKISIINIRLHIL